MRIAATWVVVVVVVMLVLLTAATHAAADEPQSPKAALDAFLADGKAKKADAVRARLFVPKGDLNAAQAVDQLIDAVNTGLFESAQIRILDMKSSDAGDAAVAAAEFRKSGGRHRISPFYLIHAGDQWKVIPSTDYERYAGLSDAQTKSLAELKTWYTRRAQELSEKFDPKDDAAFEAQRKLNTGLALAAIKDDVEGVKRFLKDGADVNGEAYAMGTPLKAAVDRDKLAMIRVLVSNGANINPPGEPMLFDAIDHGKPETVKLLVELGADVNRAWQHDTPLGVAARMGKADLVKLLLDAKADPHPQGGVGGPLHPTTLLNVAAASGDLETFNLIRPHFADLTPQDEQGENALHAVCEGFLFSRGKDHAAIIDVLLKAGVDPHAKTRRPDVVGELKVEATPLLLAAYGLPTPALDALVERVKYDREELTQALQLGVLRHPPETLMKLIDAGAEVNSPSRWTGRTPLAEAVAKGTPETVEALLARGATPTTKDSKGVDALTLARLRVVKGRESFSAKANYVPELEKTPDAARKILQMIERAAAPAIKK